MTTCSEAGKLGAARRWQGVSKRQRIAHSRKMHAARGRAAARTKALADAARAHVQ